MSTEAGAAPEPLIEARPGAPEPLATTRPLYWSVRRELWENRSIYIAPLAIAALGLLGFLIRSFSLPQRMRAMLALDPAKRSEALINGYHPHVAAIVFVAFLVALFYSLEALHGERRDRSILFWKSLPVSDLTTVLAKASIPMLVVPLLASAIAIASEWIMLLLSTAVLTLSGVGAGALWSDLPIWQMALMLVYCVAVATLWLAPVYAWLLLVSAWARRMTFLWAVLPPLGLCLLEKIAFNTSHLAALLGDRLAGGFRLAMPPEAKGHAFVPLSQWTPLNFLSSPELWLGLAAAGAMLAGAVWLRRYRDPI